MLEIKCLLLAAGEGTRLGYLTKKWPKCLMPINEIPLLDYWLHYTSIKSIKETYINLCYMSDIVEKYLNRPIYKNRVRRIYEDRLNGTAGTIVNNLSLFKNYSLLVIHADNFTSLTLDDFIKFHSTKRPKGCLITMMTFKSNNPESCGIVEINDDGVVIKFHEKVTNPPSDIANAAIYLLEPEVLNWLEERPWINDFSNEVIPAFLGKIATWQNTGLFIDIGTPQNLKIAQKKVDSLTKIYSNDSWIKEFKKNKIHTFISKI